MKQAHQAQLRLAALVGEIEGVYTAWLRARGPARKRRLLLELACAGTRLAAEAGHRAVSAPPRTRRARRALAAQRGADWLTDRFSDAP